MKNRSADTIFEKKRERRRQLAKLPFEKKIEIVVELQRAAAGIRKEVGRKPWVLERPERAVR
jgi:hypothetical protein